MPSAPAPSVPNAPTARAGPIIPADLIVGAVIWFGLAVVVAWAFVPPTGNWIDTTKAIGAGVGIATSIFAPISAIVMAKYQAQLTTSLEGLKADYTKQIEELKSSLSAGLEVKKALIAGRIRAFDAMLTSAHFFYYVLRQMVFADAVQSANLLSDADKRSAEASSVVWHLSQEDRVKWFAVYQRSIHLAGLLKAAASPDERKSLFNSHAQALGESIEKLEEAGLAAFSEADKFNLKLSEEEFRISGRPLIG